MKHIKNARHLEVECVRFDQFKDNAVHASVDLILKPAPGFRLQISSCLYMEYTGANGKRGATVPAISGRERPITLIKWLDRDAHEQFQERAVAAIDRFRSTDRVDASQPTLFGTMQNTTVTQ